MVASKPSNATLKCVYFTKHLTYIFVSSLKVCDGVLDCKDFSDECLCQNIHVPGKQDQPFKKSEVCYHICGLRTSKTDETKSRCKKSRCDDGQFVCKVNGKDDCLPLSKVCDGTEDCHAGEDENFCEYKQETKCFSGEFNLNNGSIPFFVCVLTYSILSSEF